MRTLSLALVLALLTSQAGAQPSSLNSLDPNTVVTKDELSTVISGAQPKQSALPTTGPGPGKCQQTIVPSELVTSGGMTGTPGTCSRILQCGTSSNFVVTQFNVGGGC